MVDLPPCVQAGLQPQNHHSSRNRWPHPLSALVSPHLGGTGLFAVQSLRDSDRAAVAPGQSQSGAAVERVLLR